MITRLEKQVLESGFIHTPLPIETENALETAILKSPAYLERLDHPTAMTRTVMSEIFKDMIRTAVATYPNFKVVATTLRQARSASRNDWSALCWQGGKLYQAPERKDLEILDRVGGGDSFASGLIYGLLAGRGPQWAVECGAAHGALAMTTPGDTSMATLAEVEKAMRGLGARVDR